MAINGACDVARAICNGNPNAAVVVLQPIQHSSTDRAFIVKHRRIVEDLFGGGFFGLHLIGSSWPNYVCQIMVEGWTGINLIMHN